MENDDELHEKLMLKQVQQHMYIKKVPSNISVLRTLSKTATTYSPTICSTIGVVKLNYSVRNGKRWNLHAIVT